MSAPSRYQIEANALFPVWQENGRQDHRAWLKRLMYRIEKGDPTVTVLQRNFVKEARKVPETE